MKTIHALKTWATRCPWVFFGFMAALMILFTTLDYLPFDPVTSLVTVLSLAGVAIGLMLIIARHYSALLVAALFCGCERKIYTPMDVASPILLTNSSRIHVTRIGIIEDKLAYSGRRGIYIIKDTITGKEFVGLSGIGISELRSHTVGKGLSAKDER